MTRAHALMILGTHSNAGKSLVATAFCRILARRGITVAPFKAQNMSNNAGVTFTQDGGGGEMGRAQLVQAEAAGIAPHTDMNPVLLKPEAAPSGLPRSQIVLNGKVHGHIDAANWRDIKQLLWDEVRAAYDRLAARYDMVIMEGAGSPAEINLKAGDIVNLRMARHADARCILVGDIDRGGVFAALAGTLYLLDETERGQIHGFLINKFRGDPSLLGDINSWFQQTAFGVPTIGVVPYLPDLQIADEDAVALDWLDGNQQGNIGGNIKSNVGGNVEGNGALDIALIYLPHVANFDEFAALAAEPGVRLRYVRDAATLGNPDVILLPGTKVTIADLAWLRERGMADAIVRAAANGTTIVGICGGYQMLGELLADPLGVEECAGTHVAGLGLLPVETIFAPVKETNQSTLCLTNELVGADISVHGYEIHNGTTTLLPGTQPLGTIVTRNGQAVQVIDGAYRADGRVWGCYLHGIFENDEFRRLWLQSMGQQDGNVQAERLRQREYDRLADAVEEAVGWSTIAALCGVSGKER